MYVHVLVPTGYHTYILAYSVAQHRLVVCDGYWFFKLSSGNCIDVCDKLYVCLVRLSSSSQTTAFCSIHYKSIIYFMSITVIFL